MKSGEKYTYNTFGFEVYTFVLSYLWSEDLGVFDVYRGDALVGTELKYLMKDMTLKKEKPLKEIEWV